MSQIDLLPLDTRPKAEWCANEPRIVASIGRELPSFAATYFVDIKPLANSLGINTDLLSDFAVYSDFDRFARLFELLANACDDEAFGLKYAEAYVPGGSGPFGYGMVNAPTMSEAIKFWSDYVVVAAELVDVRVTIDDQLARLQWKFPSTVLHRDQFSDFAVAILVRVIRQFMGSAWQPREVVLERKVPSTLEHHKLYLSQRLQFESDKTEVHIDAGQLHSRNPLADPRLFEILRRQCDELKNGLRTGTDLVSRLKEEVAKRIESGELSAKVIARSLAVSERSLHRRLAERGLSYKRFVDGIRSGLSLRLLNETELPLAEVARRLGFRSQSSYSRAALRWHGNAPGEVRRISAQDRDRLSDDQ